MKNILLTFALIMATMSYGQTTEDTSKYKHIEENHFISNALDDKILNMLEEVKKVKTFSLEKHSENKFSMKDQKKEDLIKKHQASVQKEAKISSLTSKSYTHFIIAVISKILIEQKINPTNFKEQSMAYGDWKLDFYKNYPQEIDILNIRKSINSKMEIELGNNTYQAINKMIKTEIDKTLNSSLNILTFNF